MLAWVSSCPADLETASETWGCTMVVLMKLALTCRCMPWHSAFFTTRVRKMRTPCRQG